MHCIAAGAAKSDIEIVRVPGAWEIPSAARTLAESTKFDAIITLGCLLRGETAHYEAIYTEVARGIGQSQQETGVPHAFGVLTCETLEQALDRAGVKAGNKGFEAAIAAIEMVSIQKKLGPPSLNRTAMKARHRWAHAASPANSPCRCSSRGTWESRPPTRSAPSSGRPATMSTPPPAASPKTSTASPARASRRSMPLSSLTLRIGASNAWLSSTATCIRAAVAEMLAYPNTPAAIIINESLEIARRYAAPESINFLNGVLDSIARSILQQRLATPS